jgi:hypothetical protein
MRPLHTRSGVGGGAAVGDSKLRAGLAAAVAVALVLAGMRALVTGYLRAVEGVRTMPDELAAWLPASLATAGALLLLVLVGVALGGERGTAPAGTPAGDPALGAGTGGGSA